MATQAAPQVKVRGDKKEYQALTNLSIPQESDEGLLTGQNDLVTTGEKVWLTPKQATSLMATGHRAGRQVPAIRPVSEAKEPLPRLHPKQLSGMSRPVAPPPPDSEQARPDPPGSSRVLITEPPESSEPAPGDEHQPVTGAMDLPPRATR